ncbi:MAG TPA: hypothetical protein VGF01_12670, partial [Terracidiphilus sp.]
CFSLAADSVGSTNVQVVVILTKGKDLRLPFSDSLPAKRSSHYGVTGSMRYSWVRLSLFDEL